MHAAVDVDADAVVVDLDQPALERGALGGRDLDQPGPVAPPVARRGQRPVDAGRGHLEHVRRRRPSRRESSSAAATAVLTRGDGVERDAAVLVDDDPQLRRLPAGVTTTSSRSSPCAATTGASSADEGVAVRGLAHGGTSSLCCCRRCRRGRHASAARACWSEGHHRAVGRCDHARPWRDRPAARCWPPAAALRAGRLPHRPTTRSRPRPDPDLRLRRAVAAEVRVLVARLCRGRGSRPGRRQRPAGPAAALAAEHEAHVDRARGSATHGVAVSRRASTSTRVALPVGPAAAGAVDAGCSRDLAGRTGAGRRRPAYRPGAQGRCRPGPAARLDRGLRVDPRRPARLGAPVSQLAPAARRQSEVLQRVLAAEHAVVYGYGVAGARLPGAARGPGRARLDRSPRAARRLEGQLAGLGGHRRRPLPRTPCPPR